jgi:glycosyltransferase involved in cell wall biosynthesis
MSSILVVLERKPFGGAERATSLILKLLANEGFNLTVVTGTKYTESLKNVKWIYSPLLDAPSKLHLWTALLSSRLNQFSELIKKSDIVYIPRLAYPVIPLAKKYGKKVVVHLHDYQPMTYCAAVPSSLKNYKIGLLSDMKASLQHELLNNGSVRRACISSLATPLNKLCKLWLSQADDIICVSQKQRNIIESAMPDLSTKLKVVYNLLPELPVTKKQLGDPTIMYLGGDSYIKGFHTFLRASIRVLKRRPGLKFLLTRDINRSLVERLNKRFGGAYNLLGYLKYREVLMLYSISHALLFPSIWEEPLPYVILETMLSGTIPIASNVGGLPEIVDGTYAESMLFEPGNVDECVDKMESLLAMSNAQIVDVGFSLKEAILKKFDPKAMEKKIMSIFLS